MACLLVLTLLAHASLVCAGAGGLVAALRSQLMSNNYDYMEDSDSLQLTTEGALYPDYSATPFRRERAFEDLASRKSKDQEAKKQNVEAMSKLQKPDHFTQYFHKVETTAKTRRGEVGGRADGRQEERVEATVEENLLDNKQSLEVSGIEELIDDLKTDVERKAGGRRHMEDHSLVVESSAELTSPATAPRYKLLELRNPSRRSGAGAAARRFLQEERADGVEIFPLDDASDGFPQFRLPSERRQYMSNTVSEEDLENPALQNRAPPPPLPVDDPDSDALPRDPLEENQIFR